MFLMQTNHLILSVEMKQRELKILVIFLSEIEKIKTKYMRELLCKSRIKTVIINTEYRISDMKQKTQKQNEKQK